MSASGPQLIGVKSVSSGLPSIDLPMNVDRPVPKIVSARPDTIWLARSVTHKKAWIDENSAPATLPPISASHSEPDASPIWNAITAPISIMPSTPRLSTPDFSASSSPSAARAIGTAAPTAAASVRMKAVSFMPAPPV